MPGCLRRRVQKAFSAGLVRLVAAPGAPEVTREPREPADRAPCRAGVGERPLAGALRPNHGRAHSKNAVAGVVERTVQTPCECVHKVGRIVLMKGMTRHDNRPHILVVGGGYVGMYTALGLQRRLRRRARITVVDPRSYMTYQPFLPEAAAGSLEPRHVVVPLRKV